MLENEFRSLFSINIQLLIISLFHWKKVIDINRHMFQWLIGQYVAARKCTSINNTLPADEAKWMNFILCFKDKVKFILIG